MLKDYKVLEELSLNNVKLLTLDKKLNMGKKLNSTFYIADKEYDYDLTHSENIIVVKSTDVFLGKTIQI